MRDVVEEKGGRFVLPLAGMRAEDLLDGCWLVVRDAEGEAQIGVPRDANSPIYKLRPGETDAELMQRIGRFERQEEGK
jgi:hypothetical protein